MNILRDEGATGFEVEVLFRSVLQDHQVYFIDKLLRVMGQYTVVDRNIIDSLLKKPMQIKYINKAVKYRLINQYKQADKKYYFTLAPGGIYYLEQIKFPNLLILPLNASHYAKARIITFNYWALDNNLALTQISHDFNWFIAVTKDTAHTKEVVCYFKNVDLQKVRENLYQNIVRAEIAKLKKPEELESYVKPEPQIVDKKYDFEEIDREIISYLPKAEINKFDLNDLEVISAIAEND